MAEFVEVMNQKKRMCDAFERCAISGCPLLKICHNEEKYPKEAEKIIMDWAKEHPIMTREEKLYSLIEENFGKELVFLFEKYIHSVKNGCWGFRNGDCIEDECCKCKHNGFWQQEWKDPKENQHEF